MWTYHSGNRLNSRWKPNDDLIDRRARDRLNSHEAWIGEHHRISYGARE